MKKEKPTETITLKDNGMLTGAGVLVNIRNALAESGDGVESIAVVAQVLSFADSVESVVVESRLFAGEKLAAVVDNCDWGAVEAAYKENGLKRQRAAELIKIYQYFGKCPTGRTFAEKIGWSKCLECLVLGEEEVEALAMGKPARGIPAAKIAETSRRQLRLAFKENALPQLENLRVQAEKAKSRLWEERRMRQHAQARASEGMAQGEAEQTAWALERDIHESADALISKIESCLRLAQTVDGSGDMKYGKEKGRMIQRQAAAAIHSRFGKEARNGLLAKLREISKIGESVISPQTITEVIADSERDSED